MQALCFTEATGILQLRQDYPCPEPKDGEALVRVSIAGVCSTDLEIVRGYVPGFAGVLGHEFAGRVESCSSQPDLVGKRVVGEINCNDANFTCSDAIFQRNHASGRSVMGIINRDGCMAEYVSLPACNLHVVPDQLSDSEAAFAEPLAAACRIIEQGLIREAEMEVAVIGDGKLGLLVAQVLAAQGCKVTMLGRHMSKMQLVQGLQRIIVLPGGAEPNSTEPSAAQPDPMFELESKFQLVVEASGSSDGVLNALRLTRPMGTLLLKSTVSTKTGAAVPWAQVANDIVVNEKVLVGSRCGPMDVALDMMSKHLSIRSLLSAMVTQALPLSEAELAMKVAQTRGVLKVQLICSNNSL